MNKKSKGENFDLVFCLFVCNRGDNIQYHSGLRSRELGQAPMVFLTPRQALSSHLLKQMVSLYWLQDRDSMPLSVHFLEELKSLNQKKWQIF